MTSRDGSTLGRRSHRTARPRILAAAKQLFGTFGFDAVSLRQIARNADVPVALVSYHFESKLGVYRATFEAHRSDILQRRKASLALARSEKEPERRLEMTVRSVVAPLLRLRVVEDQRFFASMLAREASDPRADERGLLRDILDANESAAIDLLQGLRDGLTRADAFWALAMVSGTTAYALAESLRRFQARSCEPAEIDQIIQIIVPLLLNGLRGTLIAR
jgi:AcrR family transcriptional regulator